MKKVCSRCLKIILRLTFNSMESSRTPTSLLQILKNLNLWRTYLTSGIGLLQDPLFYCVACEA